MNIKQAKEIVESLASLYPLKDYEEEAIQTVLNNQKESMFITKYQANKKKEKPWWR